MTNLVYILSASHSGSTLLAILLGSHPNLCTVGELKATNLGNIDRYRCSCGVLIRQCEFWEKVRQGMFQQGMNFDIVDPLTDYRQIKSRYVKFLLRPLIRGTEWEILRDTALALSGTWRKQLPVVQRRNVALIKTICEIHGVRTVVDSSKIAVRLKYLLRNPDLRIKVIRLIRDGRGVALSYMDPAAFADARDPKYRDGGMGGDRAEEKLTITQAAYEWRRSNEEAEQILSGLDRSQWIEIRYEDLCRRTQGTLDRLFSFLGVDSCSVGKNCFSRQLHILGNGMRLDGDPEVWLDERWRTVLTERQLKAFDTVAGKMNRQYGYC